MRAEGISRPLAFTQVGPPDGAPYYFGMDPVDYSVAPARPRRTRLVLGAVALCVLLVVGLFGLRKVRQMMGVRPLPPTRIAPVLSVRT